MRTIAHSSFHSASPISILGTDSASTARPTLPVLSQHASKQASLRRNIHTLNLHPQDIPGMVEQHALDTHFLSTFSRNTFQTVAQTQLHRTALSANNKRILGNAMGLLAIVAQLHILSRGKLSPTLGLGIVGACTASHTLRSAARLMSYSLLARALWQAACGNRHAQLSLCAAAAGAYVGRGMGKLINHKLTMAVDAKPSHATPHSPAHSPEISPTSATQPKPNHAKPCRALLVALQKCSQLFKKVDKPVGQWLEKRSNPHTNTPFIQPLVKPVIDPLLTLRISPEPTQF